MSLIAYPNALKYRKQATDPWSTATIFAKADLESLAGKFDTTGIYTEGEIVLHEGGMFKCKPGGAGPGAWDAAEWDQTTVEAELAALQTEVDSTRNTLNSKADQSDLASLNLTGTTNTSGSTITLGTFFYLNGTLVRAKVDIASGATFTLNTNYTIVTDGALNQPDIVEIIPLSIIATDVISSLGQSRCYKIGHIVLLQVSCQFAATPVGDRVLIGGVPRPIAPVIQSAFNSSKDMFVGTVTNDNGNGVFKKANDLATAAGWYNFSFIYLSYE